MRVFAAVVVAGALLVAGCSGSGAEDARKGQTGFVSGGGTLTILKESERVAAPGLTGETLDGKQWALSDQAGKVVVLNVWGSWCQPCRKEAPDLVSAAAELGTGVVFAGLNTRDLDPAPARRFVEQFKIGYPSVYDPYGKQLLGFRGQLSPSSIPTTLVIDARGKVAARVLGPVTARTLVDVVRDVSR